MTNTPNYPKPLNLEVDALYDLAWDIRDKGEGGIPSGENYEKWLCWLRRYEGFAEGELEIKNPNSTGVNLIIGYKN